jgi:RNA polymerase sigma-B factor
MSRRLTRPTPCAGTVEATIPRGRSKTDSDPTPAVDPEVWADHVRVTLHDDRRALARLVQEYEGFARSLARRMYRGHETREDLEQVALEALVVALKRFEPERGLPFGAFARPTILGSLRRHYRDRGWLIRVPRPVHELVGAREECVERLIGVLRRQPTEAEVAADLSIDTKELRAGLAAVHARKSRSLDAEHGGGGSYGETLGDDDEEMARSEDRMAAAAAIRSLDPADRRLLQMYYFEERTQAQIAAVLGVSQMQVSRILRNTLHKLRVLTSDAA